LVGRNSALRLADRVGGAKRALFLFSDLQANLVLPLPGAEAVVFSHTTAPQRGRSLRRSLP
jgi:hypothetical protein